MVKLVHYFLPLKLLRVIPLIVFVTHVGCYENNNVQLDIPAQLPAIVIEGYLTDRDAAEITVSRNNLMDDELIFQSIWNANVFLSDGKDTLSLLNIFYTNTNRNLLVNYRNDLATEELSGDTLFMTVMTTDGSVLTAQTGRVSKIAVSEISMGEHYLRVNCNVENNVFSGFLRVDGWFYSTDAEPVHKTKFFDCTSTMLPNVLFSLPMDLQTPDSLMVTVFHINEAYYRYQVSIDNAVNAYHDPFFVPENIRSNINGGIGIFTHYSIDSCRLKIR